MNRKLINLMAIAIKLFKEGGNEVRLRYFAFAALDHILFQPIIIIKCPGK
jgi:hypothetical protein